MKYGVVAFLFFLFHIILSAQPDKVKNLERFDEKYYHFGFALSTNTGDFSMDYDIARVDSLLGLETKRQSGFNLGIVTDLHLGPTLNLRFIPSLAFSQRNLEYRFLQPDGKVRLNSRPVESTYLIFPLNFKYRSERQNNFAAFVLVGGNYSLDLASQQHVDNTQNVGEDIVIKLKKHSYSVEFGGGFDFFLKYFKFATEIKYGMGLTNLIINDHTIYSEPINKLKGKLLTISLTFEG